MQTSTALLLTGGAVLAYLWATSSSQAAQTTGSQSTTQPTTGAGANYGLLYSTPNTIYTQSARRYIQTYGPNIGPNNNPPSGYVGAAQRTPQGGCGWHPAGGYSCPYNVSYAPAYSAGAKTQYTGPYGSHTQMTPSAQQYIQKYGMPAYSGGGSYGGSYGGGSNYAGGSYYA